MNRNPTPRHSEQILLRSNPVARQEAHSSQSAMFVAVWFIPWQRSSPMILLQRPFATVALYPAAPHSLQQSAVILSSEPDDTSWPSAAIFYR